MKQPDTMTPAERRILFYARLYVKSGRIWKTAARPWDRDETSRVKAGAEKRVNAQFSFHEHGLPVVAEFHDNGKGDTWVNVTDSPDDSSCLTLFDGTPETVVTAVVSALPADRRAALLRTLQTAWYAESATKEANCGCDRIRFDDERDSFVPAPEDERFEVKR